MPGKRQQDEQEARRRPAGRRIARRSSCRVGRSPLRPAERVVVAQDRRSAISPDRTGLLIARWRNFGCLPMAPSAAASFAHGDCSRRESSTATPNRVRTALARPAPSNIGARLADALSLHFRRERLSSPEDRSSPCLHDTASGVRSASRHSGLAAAARSSALRAVAAERQVDSHVTRSLSLDVRAPRNRLCPAVGSA